MTFLTDPTISLILDGDLDLNGDNTDPSGLAFRIEALGDGADWGNPTAITRTVSSWLADGMATSVDGYGNRQQTLRIRIIAETPTALAAGEAELKNRSGRRTTLSWTPPGDGAAETVFEAWYVDPQGGFQGPTGDLEELLLTRYYTLHIEAKPFSRSANLVVVPTLTVVDASSDDFIATTVDNCTSTTGWTGSPNAPTVDSSTSDVAVAETITTILSSSLNHHHFFGAPQYTLTLTRTFDTAVDMSDTPFLIIKTGMPGITWTQTVTVDGHVLQLKSQGGHIRTYVMPSGVTSFTVLKVTAKFFTKDVMSPTLRVFGVVKSNGTGDVDTGKEVARTFWVAGSARTYGSIAVGHDTDGLGDVIVYTVPSSTAGYVPSMQRYQTAGPVVSADTDAVTGVKQAIDSSSLLADSDGVFPTFTIPASQLIEGQYGIAVRVKVTTADDYNFSLLASIEGQAVMAALKATVTFTDDDEGAYRLLWLGTMALPPNALPDESDLNVVMTLVTTLSVLADTDPVYLDDLWLFNLTDGAVSIVAAGDAQRVWLDSADADRLNPTVYLGSESDRSDAIGAGLSSSVTAFGTHSLLPGRMDMFTVTTGAANPTATVGMYPRWHTHAAE